MNILFFGRLSDASDNISTPCPKGVTDTDSLIVWLSTQNPLLAKELAKPGNRIAVNKSIITANVMITDSDEVAFMSPLSGG